MTHAFSMLMINSFSAYGICRVAVALVWIYHGLVPKLLRPHADELALWASFGLSLESATRLAMAAGAIEIVFGVLILILWRQAWPLMATAIAMPCLLAMVAVSAPALLAGAFNPVSTNLCVFALAVVALKLRREVGGQVQAKS